MVGWRLFLSGGRKRDLPAQFKIVAEFLSEIEETGEPDSGAKPITIEMVGRLLLTQARQLTP